MKLLSIDIFQTLVDITPNKFELWKKILGNNFSENNAQKGWDLATKYIFTLLQEIEYSNNFLRLESIFEQAYLKVFSELCINYSPKAASLGLKAIHREAKIFYDTYSFLNKMKQKYTICLSSDADNDMLEGLIDNFSYDVLYTSENLKTYKIWKNNNFFSTIMNDFNVQCSDILHVGDASSDVIGANSANVKVCWLNRNNRNWEYSGEPDFIINNFEQLSNYI
jgi:FMN phosphatase YigB (HAD superfamily)